MACPHFRPLRLRTARWYALDGHGLEHLTLENNSRRICATGSVVGEAGDLPFGAWYRIFLDTNWRVLAFSLHFTDTRWLILKSSAPGRWQDGDGTELEDFEGCSHIDFAATPFTNTLPIRRLALNEGETGEIEALWVPAGKGEPKRARQRYTCLEAGKRYRYENLDSGFKAELPVDADGLVRDYPGMFKRQL